MGTIHPTAIIHPKAEVDPTVSVGPYAIIDEGVVVGPECQIGPHVHLTGLTTIGAHNVFHAGGVIGGTSQDLKYKGEPTRLSVGSHNIFREHVTVNRSSVPEEDTVVGDHNLLMAGSHVGHNSRIMNHVRLANGSMLGGHVLVEDYAILSGNCMVHQFATVGTLAMMQGGAAVSLDIPPFTMATEVNHIRGLNVIGLRRAGFTSEQRAELKNVYRLLFRSSYPRNVALEQARQLYQSEPSRKLIEFVATSKRGVCSDASRIRRPVDSDRNPDES